MAFADTPPPTSNGSGSNIDKALAKLSDKEREAALAWLRSKAAAPTVVKKFKDEGFQTSDSAVRRWRANDQGGQA